MSTQQTPPQLPLHSRRDTYMVLVGVAVGLLLASLAVPLIFGTPLDERGTRVSSTSALGNLSEPASGGTASGVVETATTAAPAVSVSGPSAAAPAAGTGSTSAGSGASAGTQPASGGPADTSPSGGRAPLTASDVGVTADAIKIGVPIVDAGAVSAAGFLGVLTPQEQQQGWQIYVDDLNARGGIGGRKIQPFFRTYDSQDPNAYTSTCVYWTEQVKVFAVFDNFAYTSWSPCITDQHRTPFISFDGNHEAWDPLESTCRHASLSIL